MSSKSSSHGTHSTIVGITWYSPHEWDLIPEHVADPETFDYPYQEWLSNAEKTIEQVKQTGAHACRIQFRIDDFLQWCQRTSATPDAAARCTYTIAETKRIYG